MSKTGKQGWYPSHLLREEQHPYCDCSQTSHDPDVKRCYTPFDGLEPRVRCVERHPTVRYCAVLNV